MGFRQVSASLGLGIYDRLVEDGLETTAVTCSCLIRFAAEARRPIRHCADTPSEVGDFNRAKEFFECLRDGGWVDASARKLSSLTKPSIRAAPRARSGSCAAPAQASIRERHGAAV